jgi:hypothetical protein
MAKAMKASGAPDIASIRLPCYEMQLRGEELKHEELQSERLQTSACGEKLMKSSDTLTASSWTDQQSRMHLNSTSNTGNGPSVPCKFFKAGRIMRSDTALGHDTPFSVVSGKANAILRLPECITFQPVFHILTKIGECWTLTAETSTMKRYQTRWIHAFLVCAVDGAVMVHGAGASDLYDILRFHHFGVKDAKEQHEMQPPGTNGNLRAWRWLKHKLCRRKKNGNKLCRAFPTITMQAMMAAGIGASIPPLS